MSRNSSRVLRAILAFAFALYCLLAGADPLRADPGIETRVDVEVAPVSVFFDALAPYGQWISTDEYGWVWIPSLAVVGPDFVPYATDGHWVETDSGWFFESDFEWGWAPFHYGRWYFDTAIGWVWVPGRVWAPAWVDWRIGAGVIGWSPQPPRRPHGRVHQGHWVFVDEYDFRRPHIHNHLVPRDRARRAYDRTAPVRQTRRIGDATIFRGPRVRTHVSPGGTARPIRVVPPRRGVVGRVRIVGGAAASQPMRPRPGIQRPVDRPAPRMEPVTRHGPTRAQQPAQAVRGPVRATAPWRAPPSSQSQQERRGPMPRRPMTRRPVKVPR